MTSCAAAIVLLLDASRSIAPAEWQAAIQGHADALAGPAVTSIIERDGGIAVAALAFDTDTARLMPWRVLRTREDAIEAGRALLATERPLRGGTLIGQAVRTGLAELQSAPCGAHQVLDLVSDGEAPDTLYTEEMRAEATDAGVTINALGIGTAAMEWLQQHAVTPGGFALEAPSWAEFAAAMRRKLVLESAAR